MSGASFAHRFATALLFAAWALTCRAETPSENFGSGSIAASSSPANEQADEKTEARFKHLAEELRCLVCQNQTLADSTAPLANDLRVQIKTQIAQGRSDDQIREFMVDRYGDFILYKPPVKSTTLLLWGIPFVLLIGGAIALLRLVCRADRKDRSVDASVADRPQSSSALPERFAKAREWLDRDGD